MKTNPIKKKQKLALGKGIASLLGENTRIDQPNEETFHVTKKAPVSDGPLLVKTESLQVNPYQPRKIFKESDLEQLANSLKEVGFIQPIVVSSLGEGEGFEIISGERRFRAAQKASIEQVPVLVKRVTDREKLLMAIVENVQRSDLNCVEEALSYFQLMDEFHLSQEEVAKRVGKERSSIANFLRVLKLPKKVVGLLQREELSFGHAKILGVVKDPDRCIKIAEKICTEDLSVRQAELLVKEEKKRKGSPLKETPSPFENRFQSLREELEKKTGLHFAIKSKKNGSGEVVIKYNSEDEFNDIFQSLMKI